MTLDPHRVPTEQAMAGRFAKAAADSQPAELRKPVTATSAAHPAARAKKITKTVLVALYSLLSLPVVAGEIDFDTLRQKIEVQHLKSVEQVLATLPATLRSRYVLVFSSRSLQEASYEAPRVILYERDAGTVITFNGDPGQRGFNALELMSFDERSERFEFREIVFPAPGGDSGAVAFSDPNPPRCQGCHGAAPRPVWDSSPLWPGVYGERYGMRLSPREEAGLGAFLARQKSNPRYRSLLGLERWSDPGTFRPSSRAQYVSTVQEPPNAQFGALLAALVGRSLGRELDQEPALLPFRYALLGLADGRCGGLADFLPGASWERLRPAWRSFTREVTRARSTQAEFKARRLVGSQRFEGNSRGFAAPEIMGLGFLARQVSDIGPSMWTTALEPGGYDLPQSAALALRDALLRSAERYDSELAEASELAAVSASDRYCAYLQRRSRAVVGNSAGNSGLIGVSIAGGPSHRDTSATRAPVELLRLCGGCHESGVGPTISFTDPERLARELRSRTATHGTLLDEVLFRLSPAAAGGRMPMGIALSDIERTQLELYFSQITNHVSGP
jgi:hypothetical protein